jgi:hypothetical protein
MTAESPPPIEDNVTSREAIKVHTTRKKRSRLPQTDRCEPLRTTVAVHGSRPEFPRTNRQYALPGTLATAALQQCELAENATREPLTPDPRGSGASTALRVSGVRHLDTRTDEESTKRRGSGTGTFVDAR